VELEFDTRVCGFGVGELSPFCHPGPFADLQEIVLGAEVVRAALEEAIRRGMRLVVARVGAGDIAGARALERAGFELADISVVWRLELGRQLPAASLPPGLDLRPWQPEDMQACQELVAQSMCDPSAFPTRLCTDPLLAPMCRQIHYQWVANCFSGERAHWGVVLTAGRKVVGCCLVRKLDEYRGRVEINALARDYRGKGLYKAMLIPTLEWLAAQGITYVIIKTKLSQRAVVRTWSGLGAVQEDEEIAMHWWREK